MSSGQGRFEVEAAGQEEATQLKASCVECEFRGHTQLSLSPAVPCGRIRLALRMEIVSARLICKLHFPVTSAVNDSVTSAGYTNYPRDSTVLQPMAMCNIEQRRVPVHAPSRLQHLPPSFSKRKAYLDTRVSQSSHLAS
jgi:hypothetical protein